MFQIDEPPLPPPPNPASETELPLLIDSVCPTNDNVWESEPVLSVVENPNAVICADDDIVPFGKELFSLEPLIVPVGSDVKYDEVAAIEPLLHHL